ncbi:MAG: glycosyltransferase [Bacteroidetes bacterium]|nr:glycosyltransferase [Bacteroidota bacterium]
MNKKQYVPFALNMGIRESKGEYIIILGAHSSYPLNYISSLIKASLSLKADNVGGLCIGNPPDSSLKALAIAQAMSSAFGVGDAHFRIGSKEIKQVDTVTFGCYKRSVFDPSVILTKNFCVIRMMSSMQDLPKIRERFTSFRILK